MTKFLLITRIIIPTKDSNSLSGQCDGGGDGLSTRCTNGFPQSRDICVSSHGLDIFDLLKERSQFVHEQPSSVDRTRNISV